MLTEGLKIVAAYLLGSLSGSLLLGRLRGVDIRAQGSGNAGGTNAFRTQGWRFALGVAAIDVGKSALAAWFGLLGVGGPTPLVALLCAAAVMAGHVWPVFFGFRGGKGVAAVLGALLVLWPAGAGVMLAVMLLTLLTTGYVGLGSMLGAVALVPAVWWLAPEPRGMWFVAAALTAAFVIFTHRSNLARLRAGTEHRFEKARLFARLARRGG